MRNWLLSLILVPLLLAGCGRMSKQEIVEKAKSAHTKSELQKALGKPDEYQSFSAGGVLDAETWTYKAADGEVVFKIIGDKVVLKTTGSE